MTEEEHRMFIDLLFSHRHLWITFEEYRYMQEHPDVDWEAAHEVFHEESYDAYNDLAESLLAGKPLQERLRTVLRQSELSQAEIREQMKKRR
jgi:hypothetical protein